MILGQYEYTGPEPKIEILKERKSSWDTLLLLVLLLSFGAHTTENVSHFQPADRCYKSGDFWSADVYITESCVTAYHTYLETSEIITVVQWQNCFRSLKNSHFSNIHV